MPNSIRVQRAHYTIIANRREIYPDSRSLREAKASVFVIGAIVTALIPFSSPNLNASLPASLGFLAIYELARPRIESSSAYWMKRSVGVLTSGVSGALIRLGFSQNNGFTSNFSMIAGISTLFLQYAIIPRIQCPRPF